MCVESCSPVQMLDGTTPAHPPNLERDFEGKEFNRHITDALMYPLFHRQLLSQADGQFAWATDLVDYSWNPQVVST